MRCALACWQSAQPLLVCALDVSPKFLFPSSAKARTCDAHANPARSRRDEGALAMIWAILAAVAFQGPSADQRPELTFSAHPELKRVTIQVDVGLLTRRAGIQHYWFRRTVRPDDGRIIETRWADSRNCPAARGALEALEKLEPPRPHVPGLDGSYDLFLQADGVTYRLDSEAAASFAPGRMTNWRLERVKLVSSARPTPPASGRGARLAGLKVRIVAAGRVTDRQPNRTIAIFRICTLIA